MEWIGIVLVIILLCVSIFINANLLNKLEKQEDQEAITMEYVDELESWIKGFKHDITTAYNNMKQIDSRGSFESDDEVGITFKALKEIIEEIHTLTNSDANNDNK
jgi:hypothetical protein